MKKILKIIIGIFLTLYFSLGLFLFIYQKSLIYYPNNQDFNSCPNFEDSEKLNINGTRIYYKKNSDKLIIFYHGNAGSACNRTYLKQLFEKLNLSYIFVEYAGYSNDSKRPSKEFLMKDVLNVNQFVTDKKMSKIIVMGESLGTALATYHSSIIPVDKLLLISPFFSIKDLVKKDFGIYPISLILTENYDNAFWIKKSQAKNIEIIHGKDDETVPIEQSRKLYQEINITNKKIIEVDQAHHNDIYNFNETNNNINQFLN
jgi:uncharacterized protein